MASYNESWDEAQRTSEAGRRKRSMTLDRLGLTPRVADKENCPYLENVSDDPSAPLCNESQEAGGEARSAFSCFAVALYP